MCYKYDIKYNDFGLIPFTTLITILENILSNLNDAYIFKGGTKVLTLLQNNTLQELCSDLSQEQLSHSEIYLNKLKRCIFYDVNSFD